jgi:GMP synthase (glutamine-hydrolysing)
MTVQPADSILIIDFGSQVTQLIARRVREAGVYCEIAPFNSADEAIERLGPKGIILSGGPSSVTWEDSPRAPQHIFESGLPILGICYGQQTMAHQLGGRVAPSESREFGRAFIEITGESALFDGLWNVGEAHQVWMSHGDRVEELAEGFEIVARSDGAPYAIATDEDRRFYSMMFHPEVVHTPDGGKLLANFARHICGCAGDWTMASFRDAKIAEIREQVGDGKVICGLSGGVDSAVAAVLIHEAIGEQLTCVFVDHGLMRAGEAEPRSSDCSAEATTSRWSTWTRARISSPASRASAIRRRSASSSEASSSTFSRPRRRRSAAPTSSPRARSIRT